jgi:UDP-N-acetylmuramyl tripeptide synthase
MNGGARFNVENAATSALAAACAGWPVAAIRKTLANFGTKPQDNPGRLERWPWRGATVLVDYAHNPDGLARLLQVAGSLRVQPGARLLLLLGQAGNRDDEAIAELCAVAVAARPSRIVIKELATMLRGRAPGEVPAVIRRCLVAAGASAESLHDQPDEALAARELLALAAAGDVVVLPIHTASVRRELSLVLAAG